MFFLKTSTTQLPAGQAPHKPRPPQTGRAGRRPKHRSSVTKFPLPRLRGVLRADLPGQALQVGVLGGQAGHYRPGPGSLRAGPRGAVPSSGRREDRGTRLVRRLRQEVTSARRAGSDDSATAARRAGAGGGRARCRAEAPPQPARTEGPAKPRGAPARRRALGPPPERPRLPPPPPSRRQPRLSCRSPLPG